MAHCAREPWQVFDERDQRKINVATVRSLSPLDKFRRLCKRVIVLTNRVMNAATEMGAWASSGAPRERSDNSRGTGRWAGTIW